MLDLCHPAKIANRLADTIVKGFGFGDRMSKLGHHSMDVSTVIAEFYEAFRVDKEGQSLTLLPPTMPMQTLDITFKFVEDISDADTTRALGGPSRLNRLDIEMQNMTTDPSPGSVGRRNVGQKKRSGGEGMTLSCWLGAHSLKRS